MCVVKNSKNKLIFLSILAGLGVGVTGTSLVIAIQWYCEYKLPKVLGGYSNILDIDAGLLMKFLIIIAASIVLSAICFKKLHKMGVLCHESTAKEKYRIHKIIICLLIIGICIGIILRILGGGAVLWYHIKVMESEGFMWLGGFVFTIKQHIVMAIVSLICAICAWILDKTC